MGMALSRCCEVPDHMDWEHTHTLTHIYSGVFVSEGCVSMISMDLHCGAHGSRCHWHSFNCLSLSLFLSLQSAK